MTNLAATVMERCEALGRVSEEPDLLVRPFASEAMRRTNDLVADWMRRWAISRPTRAQAT
jgi:allantoate deiminase